MQAQSFTPYSFSKLNQSYNYLSGATSLTSGSLWDDTVVVAPIGFNFKFLNNTNSSDSILFSTWGFLAFRNEYFPSPLIWMGRSMVPFAGDLREKSLAQGGAPESDISYQTTGTAGSRIFKLQCKNIGFYDDTTGTDSLNFQVWLYEGSNVIEYHYGPSQLDDNAWYWQDGGCRVGIYNDVSIDTVLVEYTINDCTYIMGDSNTAMATHITTPLNFFAPNSNYVLTGGPNNGQVFKFSPSMNTAVTNTDLFKEVYVIANHSSCILHHTGQVSVALFYDSYGNIISMISKPTQLQNISKENLSRGIYFLELVHQSGIKKTIKLCIY